MVVLVFIFLNRLISEVLLPLMVVAEHLPEVPVQGTFKLAMVFQ